MASDGNWWETTRGRFALVFLVGAGAILLLKGLGAPQWLVTTIPGLLMLGYAWTLWDFDEHQPKDPAAGDNLYYLGFLYTLTSMATSLYRFSTDGDTETIVTNFGIAIFTTILGMMLRIVVGQGAEEKPESVDEEMRVRLSEAARTLRGEIEFTVDEFRGFRERTREALEEGLSEVRQKLGEAADQAGKIGDGLREVEERTREQAARSAEQAEETAKQWQKIRRQADAVCEAIVVMAEKIAGFDFPQAFVERATEIAAEAMKEAVEERTAEVRRGTEELRRGTEEVRRGIESFTRDLAAADLPRVVGEAVAPATQDLRAASAELTASAAAIREALDSGRETGEVTGALKTGLDSVAGALAAVGERVSEVGSGSRHSLSQSLERIERANAGLEASLAELSSLVAGLTKELAARQRSRSRFSFLRRLFRRRRSGGGE